MCTHTNRHNFHRENIEEKNIIKKDGTSIPQGKKFHIPLLCSTLLPVTNILLIALKLHCNMSSNLQTLLLSLVNGHKILKINGEINTHRNR